MGAKQARVNVDTRPFVVYTYPASRQDDGTIEQDAGRAAVLANDALGLLGQQRGGGSLG